jgi:hypothetical protein
MSDRVIDDQQNQRYQHCRPYKKAVFYRSLVRDVIPILNNKENRYNKAKSKKQYPITAKKKEWLKVCLP